MIAVRPEHEDDAAAITAVNRSAFGRDDEARLIAALRASATFIPALSLVAVDDGAVVGHILFSPVTIHTVSGPRTALGLGPMAVRPERQGQGIGSALVREGLAACRRARDEMDVAAVVVVGHAGFYPRFGFTSARAYGLEPPFDLSDANWMACEMEPGALRDNAGRVTYPPAFDVL